MTVPRDQQQLHETSRNLLEEYVAGFMYSPVTKSSYTLTFRPASWEQFLRAVSRAAVLILSQIKLKLATCMLCIL